MWRFSVLSLLLSITIVCSDSGSNPPLHVITISQGHSDGLIRLHRSTDALGIKLNILGLEHDKPMDGVERLKVLRKGLEPYAEQSDLKDVLILVIDGDYGILSADEGEIVERFMAFPNHRIVFAADNFCFPDPKLAEEYPSVKRGKGYLNAGSFMGRASDLWQLLNAAPLDNAVDEQTFFTKIFIDKSLRESLGISIDSTSELLHSADVSQDELTLNFADNGDAFVMNVLHNTHPLVIHGTESSAVLLNYLGNYIGKAWSADLGCVQCSGNNNRFLKDNEKTDWPTVSLGVMLTKPIPFVEEFLAKIDSLEYPSSKIDLYLYNNQKYNEKEISDFVTKARLKYHSVEWDSEDVEIGEREARRTAIDSAIKGNNDFAFIVDANIHFVYSDVLRALIESALTMNLGIVAPMVTKPDKMFSNFWGDITVAGYYRRSEDYAEMVNFKRVGVWNVPYISSAILIAKHKLREVRDAYSYNTEFDADLSFCQFSRDKAHFMYVDNQRYYGFIADSETFEDYGSRMHPEMYQIFENRYLWESRYVHPGYFEALEPSTVVPQACPDVYDYPLMSERFTAELIEEMEFFGKWSGGKNKDERLSGGYENVPTVDIHMNQIDFERHWLYFIDEYVRPMQEKVFTGYYEQPVKAIMMFVVRYKPDEQPFLRAHHDASTYTIDVPLNKRGRDYEGGGIHYVRYNCTVAADQVGHAAMFPGRLTHLHEGLTTTKGTRYIAVSFLNP